MKTVKDKICVLCSQPVFENEEAIEEKGEWAHNDCIEVSFKCDELIHLHSDWK